MWIPALLLTVAGGAGLGLWYRRWRRRRIAARRVVEKPNSHYSSEHVRRRERRSKWGRIDLERLHPLNRDEVRRLLRIVDAAGAEALSERDQQFLDNMSLPRSRGTNSRPPSGGQRGRDRPIGGQAPALGS